MGETKGGGKSISFPAQQRRAESVRPRFGERSQDPAGVP